MKSLANQKAYQLKEEDKEDLREQAQGDNQYHRHEKIYEAQLD